MGVTLDSDRSRLEQTYKFYLSKKRRLDSIATVVKFICWMGILRAFLVDVVYPAVVFGTADEYLTLRIPEKVKPRLIGLTSSYKETYFAAIEAKHSSLWGAVALRTKFYLSFFLIIVAMLLIIMFEGIRALMR